MPAADDDAGASAGAGVGVGATSHVVPIHNNSGIGSFEYVLVILHGCCLDVVWTLC